MMRFDVLTIFPSIFDSYLRESILGRAQRRGLARVVTHNLRDFAGDRHKTVDDKPYGGGAGMVLKAEPILRAVSSLRLPARKREVVILSAKGQPFTQKTAYRWARSCNRLVLIAGRYEGIDERARVALGAKEVSIGPYVLTDGDLAAMVIISAVARLIPGVIRLESLQEESHWNLLLKREAGSGRGVEYPHYTRPETLVFRSRRYRVPRTLLSGDHKKIAVWRARHSK